MHPYRYNIREYLWYIQDVICIESLLSCIACRLSINGSETRQSNSLNLTNKYCIIIPVASVGVTLGVFWAIWTFPDGAGPHFQGSIVELNFNVSQPADVSPRIRSAWSVWWKQCVVIVALCVGPSSWKISMLKVRESTWVSADSCSRLVLTLWMALCPLHFDVDRQLWKRAAGCPGQCAAGICYDLLCASPLSLLPCHVWCQNFNLN